MVDNEGSLSNVNEPFKPEMEEDKLEISRTESAEICDSNPKLDESSLSFGGEGTETVATEDNQVDARGGEEEEGGLENHVAAPESELIEPKVDVAEMIEPPVDVVEEVVAVEDDCAVIATQTEDPLPEVKDAEEAKGDDDSSKAADNNSVDTALFVEPNREDEALDEPKLKVEALEEFTPIVDSKVEMVVTDSESQMNARGAEMHLEPQVEIEAEKESMIDADPKVEVIVTDVGDAPQLSPQLSELQTDERENEEQAATEGMHASQYKSVREIGGENVDSELIENRTVENNAETAGEDDKEKLDVVVNNSETEMTENPAGIDEENVEPETPVTEATMNNEIIGEVNACADNVTVQEHVYELGGDNENVSSNVGDEHAEDKVVAAQENLISGVEMMEDEKMGAEALRDSKLDEPVDVAENKEDAVVKEELPGDDLKTETEFAEKLELTGNDVVEEENQLAADAEMENKMGTDKILDEDNKVDTEETMSDVDEPGQDMYDSPAAEEETATQDTEMETETDAAESGKTSGGKRKRGKLSKSPSISSKATGKRKTVGEDVCFICFDGGELVLCDRRGCPKAYHPSCVNRDEAFFKSKGRWNCGWHQCSICEKNARYMCLTCTFSLCKSCTKDSVILCVRGNKGFCETCIRTVTLIENNEQGKEDTQVDFDDRSSWEFLFKDYYIELKEKLSISPAEIAEAKNPWKGADMLSGPSKQESSEAHANDGGSNSDDSIENIETVRPKRRKIRKQSKSVTKDDEARAISSSDNSEWASKELLEFVSHMKDGDTSFLSQFDVQALLLEYIKRNKLRDPRRKSQIICDARLENLFGKPRVGHFEMLKLLESHFFIRDEPNDDVQGSVVDTDNQIDIDGNVDKGVKDRKRKSRKKDRGPQSNLDDYAAIDMHNIGLIYLRRKLMEDLLEDVDTFPEKVVGTFVRIRISGSTQKQDLYRLVQVVGTSKAPEPYKIGKKTTDTMVEILNLDKTENISIDTISNQEFTEEECKRLRQSIKCGLLSRLTVGEILDKTTEIQAARVNDWLESETLRLSHLRDRASDMGRRKELRECVEKLQLLKTPEERRRRLEEFAEIHADPKMDPSYESDEDDSENEESRRDAFMRSRGISRRRAPISPGSDTPLKDSWSGGGKNTTPKTWESSRNPSSNTFSINAAHIGEIVNENSWNLEREKDIITQESNNLEKLNNATTNPEPAEWAMTRLASRPDPFSGTTSVNSQASSSLVEAPAVKINESEKMWHYKDPSGKVQGPFSMVQLRKWNNTGYFPADLRIWKNTDNEANSILLADALAGKFPKEPLPVLDSKTNVTSLIQSNMDQNSGSHTKFNEISTNLPSPTPRQNNNSSLNGALLPSTTAVLQNIVTQSPAPASASVLNPIMQTASGTAFSSSMPMVGPAVSLHTQSNMTGEMHTVQSLQHSLPAQQQTVIPMNNNNNSNLQTDTQSWAQPQNYSWATTPPNAQSSSGSFQNSGTAVGLQQPDVWRPPPPTQGGQPNGIQNNNSNPTSMGAENNQNMGWAPMQQQPNMGWGQPPPSNTNMNWVPPPAMQAPVQLQPPPNTTPGWVPPPGNNNTGAIPANPGWAPWGGPGGPPGQGPMPGNGWGPPPPGGTPGAPPPNPNVVQGNSNQGWGPPSGNQGGWGGGGRPWNRQSSFGGSMKNKRETFCPFLAHGFCKKGPRCDFRHN